MISIQRRPDLRSIAAAVIAAAILPSAAQASETTIYTYDALGRLESVLIRSRHIRSF